MSGLPVKNLRELHNIAYSTFQRSELRLAQVDQKRPSFEYLIKSSESSSFPSKDKAATSSLPRRTERWKIQQCLPAFSNSENHHLVIQLSSLKIFFKILLKKNLWVDWNLCVAASISCLHLKEQQTITIDDSLFNKKRSYIRRIFESGQLQFRITLIDYNDFSLQRFKPKIIESITPVYKLFNTHHQRNGWPTHIDYSNLNGKQ